MSDLFTLYARTLRIHAPRTWSDAQAQALQDDLEDAVDAAVGALTTRLAELNPHLTVTSSA